MSVTILDRYFLRQLLLIAVIAILIFTILWIAPEIMPKAIQGISLHQLTVMQGLQYILYQIPPVLVYSVPMAALISSVWFFRQFSLSVELIAVLSSGVSFRRLLIPIGVFGLCITVLFFIAQEYLLPQAAGRLRELSDKTGFAVQHVLDPKVTFVDKTPDGQVQKFLLINPHAAKDQNEFIILFYEGVGDHTRIRAIMSAIHGTWDQHHGLWNLENGIIYSIDADGIYRDVHPFETLQVPTSSIPYELLAFPSSNPQEFNLRQLGQYTRLLEKSGQTEDAEFYQVRLAQRYLLIWAPLILALFGAGIGVERSRARRNLGITYAIALLVFYYVIVAVCTTLGSIGVLPAFIAAGLPLVLISLAGFGILKLRKSEG